MCDVWQAIHDAWALSPEGDADQDGISNAAEAAAGSEFVFRVPGKHGKKYRIYGADSPGVPFSTESWTPESGSVPAAADDEAVTLTIGNLTSEQQSSYLKLATIPASPGLNIIRALGRGQLNGIRSPATTSLGRKSI